MTEDKPILTPPEAALVLATAASLVGDPLKDAVRKVAGKQPISQAETAALESVVADGEAEQNRAETIKRAGPKENPDTPLGRPGRQRERDLAVHARRREIIKLRYRCPPMPVRDIAKKLQINQCTVIADLNAIRKQRQDLYDPRRGQEMIAESVDVLDLIATQAMTTADAHKSPNIKARQYRVAVSALEAKVRMMQDAGMAPRAPTRAEVTGKNGQPLIPPPPGPTETLEEKRQRLLMHMRSQT